MLAESAHYQPGTSGYTQDPQLVLQNILELMPSLQNEHTPELVADFLERPDTFLEAIDLPALGRQIIKTRRRTASTSGGRARIITR